MSLSRCSTIHKFAFLSRWVEGLGRRHRVFATRFYHVFTTAKSRVLPGRTPGTSNHSPVLKNRRSGGPEQTTIPPGDVSIAATGKTSLGSPAHRTTTAPKARIILCGRFSARSATTCVRSSRSSRITADKKDTRRRRDSISTTSKLGRTILIGTPGNPAPEPRSAMALILTGKNFRNKRLSRNRFSTTQVGSAEPTRR